LLKIYIQKVRAYIQQLSEEGRQVRVYDASSIAETNQVADLLPTQIEDSQLRNVIILREDAFVDLGSPEIGSCASVLWTNNSDLIQNGRITVIGPDIQEAAGQSLPFGQVLMVSGRELLDSDHESMNDLQGIISDRIEGYMVRYMFQNMWCRVSKGLARKGFSFEVLGKAIMTISKSNNTKIEAIEIAFVTSSRDDVKLLSDIAKQVDNINNQIISEKWKTRGYSVDCSLDCDFCVDKSVCDDIRQAFMDKREKYEKEHSE
jgi:CO dehydrogenase/acetyl-CoA synthase beta subunit